MKGGARRERAAQKNPPRERAAQKDAAKKWAVWQNAAREPAVLEVVLDLIVAVPPPGPTGEHTRTRPPERHNGAMPHVTALYRHPIKGFTPESTEFLDVQPDGRIAGDRVLAFRFPGATTPENHDGLDHWPKGGGLCVRDFPTLVRLRLTYTDHTVRLETDGDLLAEERVDDAGRLRLTAAVTRFLAATADAERLERSGPLTLVGDGRTARFQDRAEGYVSVHSRASLAVLQNALPGPLQDPTEGSPDDPPTGNTSNCSVWTAHGWR